MTKITNISNGPRGIYTEDGMVVLAPGESQDLKLSKAEAKSAEEGDWFHVGDLPKPKAEADGDAKALKAAEDATSVAVAERDAEKARADAAEAKVAELTAALDAATKPKG